nr:MAG TPA: hypothetical protein [Caudoviricetes sp.]
MLRFTPRFYNFGVLFFKRGRVFEFNISYILLI